MKKNIYFYNRCRAGFALACSILMVILVFQGVLIQLFSVSMSGYTGTQAFRYFTVDSNLFVGVCALLTIPYQIDGLRSGNYHMPRWVVYLLFVGVCTVTMTWLIAVSVLAPFAETGPVYILFTGANLYLHWLNPIASMLLFIVIATDHRVRFKFTFVAIIPVFIYMVLYVILVFVTHTWADHYEVASHMPWPLAVAAMMLVYYGICVGVMALHNLMHKKQKKIIKKYYQEAAELENKDIKAAVLALAKNDKKRDPHNNNIAIPRRAIKIMMECLPSKESIEDLCKLYLEEYQKKDN